MPFPLSSSTAADRHDIFLLLDILGNSDLLIINVFSCCILCLCNIAGFDRSQDMFMNNMKFVLSYPVADHPSKGLMVSNMDLHKIIDPVLRPTYIANRRSFNTVVIDPGHGGHDSGTSPWAKNCATASRPWATRWL